MFKEILLESNEVSWFQVSEKTMDQIVDDIEKWNDANGFPFQDYYTHQVGSNKREFVIEDLEKFKKYEKELIKIIKPYVPGLKKI
jgi:hypothetical protein